MPKMRAGAVNRQQQTVVMPEMIVRASALPLVRAGWP